MGYFYALLAAFLFGANGSVSKVIIESGFSAIQLTQMRVFGAAVISGIVLLILDRRSFRLPPRQWPVIVILGVVGVGLLQATYAFAIALLQLPMLCDTLNGHPARSTAKQLNDGHRHSVCKTRTLLAEPAA